MRELGVGLSLVLAGLLSVVPPCTGIMDCMNGGTFNATTESCDCLPGFQGSECMTVITYDIVYCDFVTSITVLEGCSAEICIQTFSELPSDQAVTFVPSAGNYSISEDPYVLPLLAGSTRSVWSINTTANFVTEGTRFFTVTINSTTPALTMSTGSPTVVVYINEDINALGPPTFVSAVPNSSTEATLSWNAPAGAAMCSSSVIQGYQLDYTIDDEVIAQFIQNGTTFTVQGLQAFTSYEFTVAAAHSSFGVGPRDSVTLTTLLPPPEVTVDFNSTYLQVEWNEAANTLFYLVGLDSNASSIRANTTDLSISFNLQPGALYRVTVQATDVFNRPGDSFEQLFTAPALPPTNPRNISTSVTFPVWMLSWQPPSFVGDQFVSYRLTLEHDCSPPAVVVTNETSHIFPMLRKDIQYTLSLEAFNSAGSSPKLDYPFFQSSGIPIAFQFSQVTYTVTRGEAAELVITTGTILTFNASVTLMATGGNATAGEDYTVASPLVVPLELCGNTTRVQIPTISDYELLERSTEYFTVQVSEFDGGVETITTSITVFIVEPTGVTRVAFAAEAVSVYEGETAVVKLAANGLLTGDIAVYLLSSGAVLNEDFDALTTYFFRFENSRVAEISIPTYRDADALEGTESFSVHVVSETIPIGVELDPSRASTLVNIMNFVDPVITRHPDEDTDSLAAVAVMLPNVTDFPASRFNVRANSSFSLSCDTNSLNNTITWHRDGSDSPLPSGGSSLFSVVRSGTLSILTVNTSSPLPNGAYQCRATLSTASVLSREVFVAIVRTPASLDTSARVLFLDPPAPLDIVVQSTGAYSYILWYYNGTEEVTANNSRFVLMRFNHVLRLGADPSVSPALYKGDYQVMLISDGNTAALITITVDTPEFFFNVRDLESRAPLTYGYGETLNLTCSGLASHSAIFSWRTPTTADSALPPPTQGEEGTTSTDNDTAFSAQIDLFVPGEQAQSGLYCCVGRSMVGSSTVEDEECLNITIVDPLHLNHFEYTILTPPETLDLSAAVNFGVIQTVAWRRDGQVVNSVDSGSRVLVEASTADLFGNYTVRAVSSQGVVYEEWTLVAAYAPVTVTPEQPVLVVELEDSTFTSATARCIYTGHPKPSVTVWIGPNGRPYSSDMYNEVSLFEGNGTSPFIGQSELTLALTAPETFDIMCGAVVTDTNVIGSPMQEFATIAVYVIDYPNPCPEAGCSHFCLPLNATSTQCSCPPGLYLAENGMTCIISNPVLSPSSVNVGAVTGDDSITLSCTASGISPSMSAVNWRVNGTTFTQEDRRNVIVSTRELVSTLTFLLVEPAISGVYTCELVEYPSVAANISVAVQPGCIPDIFLPNVPVGEIVNVSCTQAHPSFNPLGVMKWQCVSHLQWLGDYSACTFKEEAQNPLALLDYRTSSLDVASALVMKSDLLSAFQQYIRGELVEYPDIQLVNVSMPYIGRLAATGSSLFLVIAELSSTSNLQQVSVLAPVHSEVAPISVGSYSVLPPLSGATILVPSDQCACPILSSEVEGRTSVVNLCRARSFVQSPCRCTEPFVTKECQCGGVFISRFISDFGYLCVQDTDGDRIPNTMDPCEACCLSEVEGGLMWPETPANTTALLSCSELAPSFNSLSYVKRFCSAVTGQWESVDNRGCTFKPSAEDAVVIFQGLLNEEVLGSLPVELTLEEIILTEFQTEFLSYGPKNITVKVYTQANAATSESPSSPPPDRRRAAPTTTPVSATVTAFLLFPPNVSSDVLFVYGGDRSKRGTPLLGRQQRNVFGIYFAQTMLYGHRPVSECTCDGFFQLGTGMFLDTCVGPSGDPCDCSFVHPEAGPVCMCTDPYAPLMMSSDGEGDGRSKRVVNTVSCAPDCDGDRIADVEDLCPDLYDPTNECQSPSAATLALLGSCPQEVDPEWAIEWMAVPLNATNTQRCPGEVGIVTGVATRHCGLDGAWEIPDVSGCESVGFRTVRLSTLESDSALSSNPAVQERGSQQVEVQPAQLAVISSNTLFLGIATEPEDRALFPQDLNTTVTFLSVVSSFAEQTTLFSDPNYSEEDLFEIVDNIIDSTQAVSWEQLAQDPGAGRDSSPLLLRSTEAIAVQFADNLDTSQLARRMEDGQLEARMEGRNSIVSAKHVVPAADKDVVEVMVESGRTFTSSQFIPAVTLPAALLRERARARGTSSVPVVTVVMDNLQNFLPLRYYNDTVPQNRTVGTLLLSTQVSDARGHSPVLAENPVTMEFPSQYADQPSFCVFWSFEAENENISLDLGGWSDANITTGRQQRESNSNISCSSTHLTTFAVLVDVSGLTNQLSPEEALAFSIVSYIGCSISLICLIATVIFLITLRKDLIKVVVNYVHLNLSISLICGLIVFLAGIQGATSSRGGCAFVAFLLHYFFLAAFSWMLCEGVVLYNLLVKVFGANDRKWIYIYSALGWGIPVPFVIISVAARSSLYRIPKSYDTTSPLYSEIRACWLPHEEGLIAAFIIPMLAIIAVNCVFVGITLRSVYQFKKGQFDRVNEKFTSKEAGFTLLKAFVIILPLLGITWVIGLLAVSPYATVFAWIFLFLNAFQGVFIFFFHVVRHDKVWPKLTGRCRSKEYTVSTNTSSGTATTLDNKRTNATMKAAVHDFQMEEGKERCPLSIKNSINEDITTEGSEVKTATDQHVRVNGSVEEEETNFSA